MRLRPTAVPRWSSGEKSNNTEHIEPMSDLTSPVAIGLLPSALTTTSSSPATLLVDLHAALNTIHVPSGVH
jgi:hypothetical protein